jgi:uracil-DNA glycosylase
MKHLLLEPEFQAWRVAAREALRAGFRPDEIDLQDVTAPSPLTLALERDEEPHGAPVEHPHISHAFLEAARVAAVHRDPQRWNLLYRVLYRMQSTPHLLKIETDEDVIALLQLEAQVRRDLSKMQAFVRFHKVLEAGDPAERPVVVDEPLTIGVEPEEHHLVLETPTPFGPVQTAIEPCLPPESMPDEECERFIAWYQPDHRILPLAAPFFAERFAILRWTIMTPDASVSWNPAAKTLTFAPGVPRESAPADDELEELWRRHKGLRAPRARR